MDKTCTKCGKTKPEEAFNWRNKSKGWKHSHCQDCTKRQDKKLYSRTKEDRKEQIKANRQRIRRDAKERILEHFDKNPCVDCGETDPVVLQFDHVRGTKVNSIAKMVGHCSWSTIEEEITKCEVRCANCHIRRHAKERALNAR